MPELVNHALRKGAHVVAYGLLGLLAWFADRRTFVALAMTAAVAVADETRQSLTLTRSGTVWDVLLDLAGAALAILVIVPAVRARFGPRESAG